MKNIFFNFNNHIKGNIKLLIYTFLLLNSFPYDSYAQIFTDESTSASITSISIYDLGDVDNDGDIDMIKNSSVYKNNGYGKFSLHPISELQGKDIYEITIGNIYGNGNLDLFIKYIGDYSDEYRKHTLIFKNDGDGNYTLDESYPNFIHFNLVDINNDGVSDLFSSNTLYLNNGLGNFELQHNYDSGITGWCTSGTSKMHFLNINNDGLIDVMYSTGKPSTTPSCSFEFNKFYINNGNNTFSKINSSGKVGNIAADKFGFGDVDGDGIDEVILGGTNYKNINYSYDIESIGILLFKYSSQNNNYNEVMLATNKLPDFLNSGNELFPNADFDMDGYEDFVIPYKDNSILIKYGDEDCSLTKGKSIFIRESQFGGNPSVITLDIDGDKDIDIISEYKLLRNSTNTITLSLTANPVEGGSVELIGEYGYGQVTLTATAFDEYKFINWTENGEQVSINEKFIFEAIGSRNLVANFKEKHYTLKITDVIFEGGKIKQYINIVEKDIIIPEILDGQTVSSIGTSAFAHDDLIRVIIPNTVTFIEEKAFYACDLTSVEIPNSVTSIGKEAFYANQLTDIIIPNSITSIEYNAFASNNLTSITIPNSVTTIAERAFMSNDLTNISIPNSVTYIGRAAFNQNKLVSVTIPNYVTYIGEYAFFLNKFSKIKLPVAIKEGYIFDNWNGVLIGNTSVSDLKIAYEANFHEDVSLTIKEIKNELELLVYPNPSTSHINVSAKELEKVEIYNSGGLLKTEVLTSNDSVVLNIKGYRHGIYILKIYARGRVIVKKQVVK